MPNQSLLIISSDKHGGEEEILVAGKKAGYEMKMLLASDLTIVLDSKNADVFHRGKSIRSVLQKSRIIFRRTRAAQKKMITLAILADHWNIPHTDSTLSIMSNLDKSISMPALTMKHIQNIPTMFVQPSIQHRSGDSLPTVALAKAGKISASSDLTFPLLAKPAEGRHGEGIALIKNAGALLQFLKRKHDGTFLLQSFLKIDEEYRVFIVGKKSLGAIKKIKAKGALVANYAAGAKFLPTKIPTAIEKEAIDICLQQGIDVAGIDIARVGKKFYLLEVNRCPEFSAFKEATGIEVASKIVRFIMKRSVVKLGEWRRV